MSSVNFQSAEMVVFVDFVLGGAIVFIPSGKHLISFRKPACLTSDIAAVNVRQATRVFFRHL